MTPTPLLRLLTAVLLLAVCPSPAPAQVVTRPTTFLNLPWGCSRAEICRALTDLGANVPEELPEPVAGRIEISGGKFAGQAVTLWTLEMVQGKLVGAWVALKAVDGNSAGLYREIRQQLVKKYGLPPAERKYSKLTPEQRREYMLNGSRLPTPATASSWKFLPNLKEKETLSLTCEHASPPGEETAEESQYLVTLRYANESMKAQLTTETGAADQGKQRGVQARDL